MLWNSTPMCPAQPPQIRNNPAKIKPRHKRTQRALWTRPSLGCFPLCQTDKSEMSGNTRRKWNDIFQLYRLGQPIGMALATFFSFSEFPNLGKESVCLKWNGEFRSEYSNRIKWTTSRGDFERSGRKKQKRSFAFEFRPTFPESLA